MSTIKVRNAVYCNKEKTLVDAEIEHPDAGWIPYTLNLTTTDSSYDNDIRNYIKTHDVGDYVEPDIKDVQANAIIEMSEVIQTIIDKEAQKYRYDDMVSARSYCGWDNPFRTECESLGIWAANCWVTAGQIESEVSSGLREMPTIEEVVLELPVYEHIY